MNARQQHRARCPDCIATIEMSLCELNLSTSVRAHSACVGSSLPGIAVWHRAVTPIIHGVRSLISVSPPSASTRAVLWRCTRTGGYLREFRNLNWGKMVSSWLQRGREHHLHVSASPFPICLFIEFPAIEFPTVQFCS